MNFRTLGTLDDMFPEEYDHENPWAFASAHAPSKG
jgi:hypothetical protein